MEIELGIQNAPRAVTFATDATAQEVAETIKSALAANEPIELLDNKGRNILVPANMLAYAVIGSEARHAVGFNNLD
ncbi:DUF3107 domain-containing protein [Bifidobacterium magnum]|uniref:Putative ATP-binding protein n=1 Tax=Bifidobacterium magnum TaxID=1692 RepID=A0A087BAC6_9BIFI|nr:DUF3107 domain-containing protein [Bifidobacterium magnum]KFI67976.1 putative ATP-binding protein [Bifidobacterium magnum]